jgi:hypothetical protein
MNDEEFEVFLDDANSELRDKQKALQETYALGITYWQLLSKVKHVALVVGQCFHTASAAYKGRKAERVGGNNRLSIVWRVGHIRSR